MNGANRQGGEMPRLLIVQRGSAKNRPKGVRPRTFVTMAPAWMWDKMYAQSKAEGGNINKTIRKAFAEYLERRGIPAQPKITVSITTP